MWATSLISFLLAVTVSCCLAREFHQQPACLDGQEDGSCSTLVNLLQRDARVKPVVVQTEGDVELLSAEEMACFADILPQLSHTNTQCAHQCGSLPTSGGLSGLNSSMSLSGSQLKHYIKRVKSPSVTTICETGFYVGESAAMWLCINPHATLYSFDLEFPQQSLEVIRATFGERFVHFEGDSTQTLAEFAAQPQPPPCEVMIQDGGHYGEVPESDMMNFAKIATKSPGIEHTLFVDEVFYSISSVMGAPVASESGEECCPDVTELIVNKTIEGAFDSNSSWCFSRDANHNGKVVTETKAFEVTPTGLQAMNSAEAELGGWCELVFAPNFLASVA